MLIDNTMRRHKGSIVGVMEELCLPRRTLNEKMAIGQKYLVPKQVKAHGLKRAKLPVTYLTEPAHPIPVSRYRLTRTGDNQLQGGETIGACLLERLDHAGGILV